MILNVLFDTIELFKIFGVNGKEKIVRNMIN